MIIPTAVFAGIFVSTLSILGIAAQVLAAKINGIALRKVSLGVWDFIRLGSCRIGNAIVILAPFPVGTSVEIATGGPVDLMHNQPLPKRSYYLSKPWWAKLQTVFASTLAMIAIVLFAWPAENASSYLKSAVRYLAFLEDSAAFEGSWNQLLSSTPYHQAVLWVIVLWFLGSTFPYAIKFALVRHYLTIEKRNSIIGLIELAISLVLFVVMFVRIPMLVYDIGGLQFLIEQVLVFVVAAQLPYIVAFYALVPFGKERRLLPYSPKHATTETTSSDEGSDS